MSSKLPVQMRQVPQVLIELSTVIPAVFLNLRAEQREIPQNESPSEKWRREYLWNHSDSGLVYAPVTEFLRSLKKGEKLLICFQSYSPEKIGTAVIALEGIYWTTDDYPRLDFAHSEEFEKLYGCPNFWGVFILAIAKVPNNLLTTADSDNDFSWFIQMAKQHASTTP